MSAWYGEVKIAPCCWSKIMLLVEDRGLVRWITLSRPDRLNAVQPDGWDAFRTAVEDFVTSDQRVMVLTGAGKGFCAGADLSGDDLANLLDGGASEAMARVGRAAQALHDCPKPTIAAVNGVAAGAGMNMALGCDVVIGSTAARFTEVFVRRGLTVDFGGTWYLPRHVGLQRAKELSMTGRIVAADEALQIGLLLEMVDEDALEQRAQELAEVVAANAPLGLSSTKSGINASFARTLGEALKAEGEAQVECFGSRDMAEGVLSFQEKRPPEFQGK